MNLLLYYILLLYIIIYRKEYSIISKDFEIGKEDIICKEDAEKIVINANNDMTLSQMKGIYDKFNELYMTIKTKSSKYNSNKEEILKLMYLYYYILFIII